MTSTRSQKRLQGERTGVDTIVENGDIIAHTLHRHEPPVSGRPVGIVYEDDGMIVIDKPAGVPVHPTGRYNYNSVTEILKHERPGFLPLRRCYGGCKTIYRTESLADYG